MADTLQCLAAALADRYRVERELGHGGMARVYLAEDLKHHRPVALKVLKPEVAAALGPERFLREIEIAAGLTHPHILPIHDSGRVEGAREVLYYVMPYVEGESLRERIDRERQLPVDDALQIAREMADALSYAHSRGIIHRDIKPENVLLESGHAVIADFGIARAVDQAAGERITGTGVSLGTPTYMSPEQAAGSSEIDGRADLYALGCVVHEMLAGQPPFTGPVESLIQQHLTADPPNIQHVRPTVPDPVAAAVQRALAKMPADRYNPVGLFAEALSLPRSDAAPAAGDLVGARRHWFRERRVLLGTVAAIAIAAFLFGTRRPRPPGAESPAAVPRVVVFPFANLGAADDAYFAAGLTDAVTARLAEVPGIQVVSRSSAVRIAAGSPSLAEVRRRLGATHALEGTVQRERAGDPASPVRVIPQLIELEHDTHVWAATFDREGEGVFAIQSAIADSVAAALALTFGGIGEARRQEPVTHREAFDAYLMGLYFAGQATTLGYDSAMYYLERAVAQDSTFAAAFAALAFVYADFAGAFEGTAESHRKADAAARRAIALDSSLADGWGALARVRYSRFQGFAHVEAVRALTHALSLNPNLSTAHDDLAFVLSHVGMLDGAEREVRRTRVLDPLNRWAQFRLAHIALIRGEYALAADDLARLPIAWAGPYQAEALVGLGRPTEALGLLVAMDSLDADAREPLAFSIGAVAAAHLADTTRALDFIRRATDGLGFLNHAHHAEYNIGAAYAVLGEHDQALEWFHRAVAGGFPCPPAYERAEFLGGLPGDPRYAAFLAALRKETAGLQRAIRMMLDE